MIWLPIILLVAAVYAVAIFALRLSKEARLPLAAALLFGLAGYGLQGHPGLAGSRAKPTEDAPDPTQAALVAERQRLGSGFSVGKNVLITADALMRQGQFGSAATLLSASLRRFPDDAELWLALANAEVAHANGVLTPPASFAYRRAMTIAPDHPGPPYFLGLALITNGKIMEGRELWANAVAHAPAGASWKEGLAGQLARLDALIAAAAREGGEGGSNGAASRSVGPESPAPTPVVGR